MKTRMIKKKMKKRCTGGGCDNTDDDDKKHDDDNDAEEPPGVWHTSTNKDIIIDEPMQSYKLREKPKSLMSLFVGEKSGEVAGEAGEAGAPGLARQIPVNPVNSRNTSIPLSSLLSTSPHAGESGSRSPQLRTAPGYNSNSGTPLDRSSTPGVGLQSSPQAYLRISPAALSAFDSSPAIPELPPIQGISNSIMALSNHEFANWPARIASAPLSSLAPVNIPSTSSDVENAGGWHQKSETEHPSGTVFLPTIPLAYPPTGTAGSDFFSHGNPTTIDSKDQHDMLHEYSHERYLNPVVPSPKPMMSTRNHNHGARESIVKIKGSGPHDEVNMKLKEREKSGQNTDTHMQPTPSVSVSPSPIAQKRKFSSLEFDDFAKKSSGTKRTVKRGIAKE